jgi:hypothetical protein
MDSSWALPAVGSPAGRLLGEAEESLQRRARHDEPSSKAQGRKFAAAGRLVRSGLGDAENYGGFLDGEGESSWLEPRVKGRHVYCLLRASGLDVTVSFMTKRTRCEYRGVKLPSGSSERGRLHRRVALAGC